MISSHTGTDGEAIWLLTCPICIPIEGLNHENDRREDSEFHLLPRKTVFGSASAPPLCLLPVGVGYRSHKSTERSQWLNYRLREIISSAPSFTAATVSPSVWFIHTPELLSWESAVSHVCHCNILPLQPTLDFPHCPSPSHTYDSYKIFVDRGPGCNEAESLTQLF